MLRSALASWTLFFGLLLIMSGNGLQVVLLGTEATEAGFSKVTTGFVMAGYFLGIFCGSLLVPKLLDNVGHVRVFAALGSLISAVMIRANHGRMRAPCRFSGMRISKAQVKYSA